MPRFFLNQPDGKLAIFSTVVDDFTFHGMDDAEALVVATEEFGREVADEKIARGRNDEGYREAGHPDDGLHRWRHALNAMVIVHGLDVLKERMEELGFGDLPVPPGALRAAEEVAAERALAGR